MGNPFGEVAVTDFLSTLRTGDHAPLALLIAAVRHHEAGQPASDDVAGILFAIT